MIQIDRGGFEKALLSTEAAGIDLEIFGRYLEHTEFKHRGRHA